MLQKVLVVLLGFVVSVVGALAPSGLFASTQADMELAFQGTVKEETLASIDGGGSAFARIPTLWIEADGQRVTEDAWGTGDVKELKFKVGVKDVEGTALLVGDKHIPLEPTDVITVRMFRGDFAYRGVTLAGATLQLQGTVKTTMLAQGDANTKIRTEIGGIASNTQASASDNSNGGVAYVVLDTGKRMDTVAVEDGGRRLFTEEATTAAASTNSPGNLLAKWVKINGKTVKEYTWGEGQVDRIEFEPASKAGGTVVIAFDKKATEALSGQRVLVEDFVGTYTAFPVSGDRVRIGLDGYAAIYRVGDGIPNLPLGGSTAPNAAFDIFPPNPRSSDTITFTDRSTDDGEILFRTWDFAGQRVSVLNKEEFRFTAPGDYEVTLKVTDDDLQTSSISRTIKVRNALPVASFDFAPRTITSDTLVQFTDTSTDSDNAIVSWQWDFGDGNTSLARNPTHRFAAPGNINVTLTVKDELDGVASQTRTVQVRNAPPLPSFTFSPLEPQSGIPVQFISTSTDRDGQVVNWTWDFGDETGRSYGSAPTHAFTRPLIYTVTLTARDDAGGTSSTSQQIRVVNRPAIVDFTHTPPNASAGTTVTFTSTSRDPDGAILHHEWRFSHVAAVSTGSATSVTFPKAGTYWVNLTVVDSSAESSWLNRTFVVDNSAPIAKASAVRNPGYRDVLVNFTDLSTDVDGDAIIAWHWSFGDGTNSTQRNPQHAYSQLGVYPVTLTVTDSAGKSGSAVFPVSIINARPLISNLNFEPKTQVAGAPVTFFANATDPDLRLGDPLRYEWHFADQILQGKTVSRSFPSNGAYAVTLVVYDTEGGISPPRTETITIDFALPRPAMVITPLIPTANDPVQFRDVSTSPNGNITARIWEFGDGTTSTLANPTHRYVEFGTKIVRLTVTDSVGKRDTLTQQLLVNARPVSLFEKDQSGTISIETTIAFVDRSTDADGQIVEWRWDYGDGVVDVFAHNTSTSHKFASPGQKTVKLTVTDNHGATHTSSQSITVENRRPVARWTHSAPPLVANQPVSFTSESFDPDGTPIASWDWTFGDGERSTVGNTTHAYLRSGAYTVTLRVSDGALQSSVDSQAFKIIRVGADHPLSVGINAVYPGNQRVDLRAPDIITYVDLVRNGITYATIDKSQMSYDQALHTYTGVFDIGTWARGDQLFIRVQNTTFQAAPVTSVVNLADDSISRVDRTFELAIPLDPTISVKPGDDDFVLALGSNVSEGVPVYRDPTERIDVTGHVALRSGDSVSGATARLELRYVPLSAAGTFLSGNSALGRDVFGWCEIMRTTTNGAGNYAFEFSQSTCLAPGAPMLPGVYQVRSLASYSTATQGYSPVATFIVDPTGQLVPFANRL